MDIDTITSQVAAKLADTDSKTSDLISSAMQYISDFQAASEMQYVPAISPKTAADFKPKTQKGDNPPDPKDASAEPDIPAPPPALVTADYTVADPVDISAASAFSDPPALDGDSPKIVLGEPITTAIADAFIKLVEAGMKDSYSYGIVSGAASRMSLTNNTISRVRDRMAYLGLSTDVSDMGALADYQARDNTRVLSAKRSEVAVDNDMATVQAALSLAGTMYQNADAVYNRALDVAKTILDVGNSIYQMRIGVERSAIGVAKTVQQSDFEITDAKESLNKLNLHVYKENGRIFDSTSEMVMTYLKNITGQYETKVSRYGVATEASTALINFDLAKSRLSQQALSERVDVAIRNAINALDAFTTVIKSKQQAINTGEGVYSEAIRGVMEARSTLIHIGDSARTTTIGK